MAYPPYKMKGPALYKNDPKKNTEKPKEKKKTFEDYMEEGFSPEEARQMAETGATTGKSAVPFMGKLLSKAKSFAGGVLKGKDGKFGVGDVGRLALGPMGAVAGGLGLFKKGKKPTKKY